MFFITALPYVAFITGNTSTLQLKYGYQFLGPSDFISAVSDDKLLPPGLNPVTNSIILGD
jgi:hypothetical protein